MSTCTVEEKIIQRQLSKEGLQNIVDDKNQVCVGEKQNCLTESIEIDGLRSRYLPYFQVNQFSTSELKSIFRRRKDPTRSDTHDTLRCKRCSHVRTLDPAAMDDLQKCVPATVLY